jgi:hypothetical protein
MVSGEDLKNILGDNLKIIKFEDLKNYKKIDDLLPKIVDYCIIFYTEDRKNGINYGHWTCLLRYKNYYEFFDSYGLNDEQELKFISKDKKILFGENVNYLKNLLKPVKHSYNKFDYQQWDEKITTCGRFVLIRIYLFKNGIITNDDFYKIMKKKLLQSKLKNYDELSLKFT